MSSLTYFEVTSPAAEAAQEFYRAMFGWDVQVIDGMGGYALVNTHGEAGAPGGGIGPLFGPTGGVRIYFSEPDLAAGLKRAVELGGTVLQEPTEIPGFGSFAVFADPDGNPIGLWDRPRLGA
ncbi:VOC family protein [Microbacterium gorillae]|uniref:VOC family protein n=1 Tax=Microbacterium gorillae TaxID=1231063 RepID=UPI000ADA5AC5|nr:VOC family protein [Microbacterium gorillae]